MGDTDTERVFLPRPLPSAPNLSSLKKLQIPLEFLEDACRGCAALDGDDNSAGYPRGFDVDMESEMLGSMNEYGRQILISTGKSDWIREVTDDSSSVAGLVKASYEELTSSSQTKLGAAFNKLTMKLKGNKTSSEVGVKGIYPTSINTTLLEQSSLTPATGAGTKETSASSPSESETPRLSVLNSSFYSSSRDEDQHSVIVLPDYKIVHHVPTTREGSDYLVQSYLSPCISRVGPLSPSTSSPLKSWPLPYHAVILLCSHKRRDKRCHIAAPLLATQFYHHLEHHNLEVDERGDDLQDGEPIEDWKGSVVDRERRLEEELSGVRKGTGRVGLFKISHIGGHRYAGNVIIYLPNGISIWYGRVTPQDVGAIVETTLIKGKVIPELLRGGLGLTGKAESEAGVLSW